MGHEAIKLELIEWLMKLDDDETLDYLKLVKESNASHNDWWDDLTEEQKSGIEEGLKDIEAGRVVPHDTVKQKYGL